MASATKTAAEESTLFAEIRATSEQSRQSTCTVGSVLEELGDIDRVGLTQALDSPKITGTAIAEVLKRRGHQISSHTVQRHRRGGCGCAQ